jgi:hypothetical protein
VWSSTVRSLHSSPYSATRSSDDSSHGTTSVTFSCDELRYLARSSGLMAVPVIHGSAAVVTMYMGRWGRPKSLSAVGVVGSSNSSAVYSSGSKSDE